MKNKLKYIVSIFLSICLSLCSSPVVPSEKDLESESELSRVIQKIKAKEETLQTFTARFVQTKRTYLLQEPLHSEGLIYFDSKGKMLWKVTTPSRLEVLLKDNMLIIHYPDLSESEERRLGRTDRILKKYFGIGQSIEELRKQYEIHLMPIKDSEDYHLKLIPKRKAIAKHIDAIEVVVDSEHWLPERIYFKEVKGDFTSLVLQFTSVNEPLPPDIFAVDHVENRDDDLHPN